MKKNYSIISKLFCGTLLSVFVSANAQNLVPNPGFEVQDSCPAVSEIFVAQPWTSATMGTPDAFNSTCPTQNTTARTGVGSAGVYCFNTFANNREYMTAPLSTPMVAGQTYFVSFWVKRSNYRYAVNRIGAYFSSSSVYQSTTSVLNFTPQVQNPTTNFMTSSTSWMSVSGSFVATGGESFILIGNFSDDANTDTLVANSGSTSKVAYYKVDDISVTATAVGMGENFLATNAVLIYPNPLNDVMNINVNPDAKVETLVITNTIGQVVKVLNVTDEGNSVQVPVADLAPGIYSVTINTNEGALTRKVVIAD